MRILVVEGNPKLALQFRRMFAERGYVVDVAFDGVDGMHMANVGPHDMLILDDKARGLSNLGFLSALRQRRQVSAIMIGHETDVDEKVRWLQLGADDYVNKPVSFAELLARVEALRRRQCVKGQDGGRLTLGDLEIDLMRRHASRQGRRLDLTGQEFLLLSVLLRHQSKVLSRSDLLGQLWDNTCDCESNVVDVAIRRLRTKLDAPFEVKLLHTVRGAGYVLERRECASEDSPADPVDNSLF